MPADTVLQCVAAHVCGSIKRQDILKIDRAEFIDSWDEAKDGLFAAIDYLRSHLGVMVSRILPYNALLIPLSWFFIRNGGRGVSRRQHDRLRQYFYWVSLSNRFNSTVPTKVEADLDKMQAILDGRVPRYDRRELRVDAEEDLKWRWFSVGDAFCKAIVCLLSEKGPRRLNTNGRVHLDNSWLKASSSKNYHHFFPKAFLKRLGYEQWAINSTMNIVLVDDYLNKRVINAKKPSKYVASFGKENGNLVRALRTHYIGSRKQFGS